MGLRIDFATFYKISIGGCPALYKSEKYIYCGTFLFSPFFACFFFIWIAFFYWIHARQYYPAKQSVNIFFFFFFVSETADFVDEDANTLWSQTISFPPCFLKLDKELWCLAWTRSLVCYFFFFFARSFKQDAMWIFTSLGFFLNSCTNWTV